MRYRINVYWAGFVYLGPTFLHDLDQKLTFGVMDVNVGNLKGYLNADAEGCYNCKFDNCRKLNVKATFLLLSALFLFQPLVYAQENMPVKDLVKGAKDHPLLSRFESAKIIGYEAKAFDEVELVAGKRVDDSFQKTLSVEGKFTKVLYNYPKDRSSLEVMRNYQTALEKAGLKVVFSCAKEACGKGFGQWFTDELLRRKIFEGNESYFSGFIYGRDDVRYLVAAGTTSNGVQVHVAVLVMGPADGHNGGIYLQVVEGKPMEQNKVSVNLNAADMAKGIAAEGKVAVYGILFDTDKGSIKPESKPALAEMAKLLQKTPQLKVYIVGHTDNQGALAHNMELSQQRADAVVKALITEYKVDVKRLSSKGVASYSPVASNDDETGRATNRRVELVKQ